jgi:hypothetical protein
MNSKKLEEFSITGHAIDSNTSGAKKQPYVTGQERFRSGYPRLGMAKLWSMPYEPKCVYDFK